MPLLDPEIFYEKVAFRLCADVSADLQAYARYLNSTPYQILNSARGLVFRKDKEFQSWKLWETSATGEPMSKKGRRGKKAGPVNAAHDGEPLNAESVQGRPLPRFSNPCPATRRVLHGSVKPEDGASHRLFGIDMPPLAGTRR